jgi:hypothetical protein
MVPVQRMGSAHRRRRRRARSHRRPLGRLAGFTSRIRARYGVAPGKPRFASLVLRHGVSPEHMPVASQHRHTHLHPVLHQHTVSRVLVLSRLVPQLQSLTPKFAPATRARLPRPRTAIDLKPGVASRRNRTGSVATSWPTARTARPPIVAAAPPAVRRTGPRPATVLTPRLTVRTAPKSTTSERVAAAQPVEAPTAVGVTAGGIAQSAPRSPSVALAPSLTGVVGQPELDLDVVTTEVLRRIEGRAIAQRERLGRGTF